MPQDRVLWNGRQFSGANNMVAVLIPPLLEQNETIEVFAPSARKLSKKCFLVMARKCSKTFFWVGGTGINKAAASLNTIHENLFY